jgi:hypothetical protein
MTINEFGKIISLIRGAFPHMDRFKDDDVKDVWYECLEDLRFDVARKATLNTIKRAKDFPPDIATIREEYDRILEECSTQDRAVRDAYRSITNVYTGIEKLDQYLTVFRERCGNDPAVAIRLRTALERFSDTKYQWLPNLGQAIMCIDIDTQTIPDEMMKLVQEYKNQMLPDDVIRKWSKMPPSKTVDERK